MAYSQRKQPFYISSSHTGSIWMMTAGPCGFNQPKSAIIPLTSTGWNGFSGLPGVFLQILHQALGRIDDFADRTRSQL
jgi:hypothetical protein